jgi:hypothetical protein
MDKKKLTEEEIKDLAEVRTSFQQLTLVMGETEIASINLKARKESLTVALKKLDEKQSEIANKLEEKYGKGSISLDTNEFTPTTDDK